MESKRRARAAAFVVWAALLVLLAAALLRTTSLGANLVKALTPAPTATAAPPTPTPVPLHTYQIPVSIGQYSELIAWPYGLLWLNYPGGLERIDIQGSNLNSPAFTQFPVAGGVTGICLGPDSAVWFTEAKAAKIGHISSDGTIQEFALPGAPYGGAEITTGSDGALWFGMGPAVGRLTTSGAFQSFPLNLTAPHAGVSYLAAGPDGAIWFTDLGDGSIGRVSLNGAVKEYLVPSGNPELSYITAGPDGALWFTEGPNDLIGRITTAGQFTEFPAPGAEINRIDNLTGITVGPDKALWFTEAYSHRVGRITTKGIVTNEYAVSTSTKTGGPVSIAATNNAVWFIDPDTNTLARIDVK